MPIELIPKTRFLHTAGKRELFDSKYQHDEQLFRNHECP
jgi:hypothetical protein